MEEIPWEWAHGYEDVNEIGMDDECLFFPFSMMPHFAHWRLLFYFLSFSFGVAFVPCIRMGHFYQNSVHQESRYWINRVGSFRLDCGFIIF